MPTSEAPATDVNEPGKPNKPPLASPADRPAESSVAVDGVGEPSAPNLRGSRWVDYDTHELLEMISELEDERRWARLREGALWALLVHLALLVGIFLLPKYISVPRVVDKTARLDKDEFTYMDTPKFRPKVAPKPTLKPPQIDKQTLEEMRKQAPAAQVPPPPETKPTEQPPVQPPPPQPTQQSQVEAPRPSAVPARPNFAMNSANPADQLREAMRNAARSRGAAEADSGNSRGLAMHPGAGSGGVQVLSDTQGVDFSNWLQRWHWETEHTWDPLIPDEVNPPIYKSGAVAIRFKVLPNGRLMDGSLVLEGRSGDVALDRAAWGALTGSSYPALPRDFHGPYLELRAYFLYNMEPPK